MDKIRDEDRKRRLRQLEDIIKNSYSVGNVDSLLDTVQALHSDCDHPAIKKLKNVEVYSNRCKIKTNFYFSKLNFFLLF